MATAALLSLPDIVLAHPLLVVSAIAGLSALYCLAQVVYNLFFHPLRHYPGPRISAASGLVDSYHHYVGTTHLYIKRLHDRYGTVVRVRPGEISYIENEAWRDIYGQKTGSEKREVNALRKHPHLYFNLRPHTADLFRANDTDHKRLRRLLNWGFSTRAVEQQGHVIQSHLTNVVNGLYQRVSNPQTNVVDITLWIDCLTFDVGCDLLFGRTFRRTDIDTRLPDQITITKSFQLISRIRLIFRMPYWLQPMLWLGVATKKSAIREHMANSERMMRARLVDGITGRNDIVDALLEHNKDGSVTDDELVVAARIILAGSTETTSLVMSTAIYQLSQKPHYLKRLREELHAAFSSPADMTVRTVGTLPWLHAIILETMRIMPPMPANPARLVEEPGMICGEIVPTGTTVGIQLYAAYRSSANFAEPDSFLPERWLPEAVTDPRFMHDNRPVFQPFGVGPRRCLAEATSWAELKMFTAHMLWNFDFELQEQDNDWTDARAWLTWHKKPLFVKVTPVQQS